MAEVILIGKALGAFFALGWLCGIADDLFFCLRRAARLPALVFLLDVLMMLLFGSAFVCVLIAYAGGSMRGMYLPDSLLGFLLYTFIFHRKRLNIAKSSQKRKKE